MNAKKYLKEVRRRDVRIDQKIHERETLYSRLLHAGAANSDRVQHSTEGDALSAGVARLIDLDNEIKSDLDAYISFRELVMKQIEGIDPELYSKVIYEKYMNYKELNRIALELGYSYNYIRRIHGEALQVFDKKYLSNFRKEVTKSNKM